MTECCLIMHQWYYSTIYLETFTLKLKFCTGILVHNTKTKEKQKVSKLH